jgi:hypothetical protein
MISLQDQAEEFGDGCTNEFQRAFAVSQMTTPRRNDRSKAAALVRAGKFVVLHCYPVYCRATDAVLGEACAIVSVANTYEEAVGKVLNAGEPDPEDRYEVLPAPAAQVSAYVPQAESGEEVPF